MLSQLLKTLALFVATGLILLVSLVLTHQTPYWSAFIMAGMAASYFAVLIDGISARK